MDDLTPADALVCVCYDAPAASPVRRDRMAEVIAAGPEMAATGVAAYECARCQHVTYTEGAAVEHAHAPHPVELPPALAATVHGSRSYSDAVDAVADYDPREDGY